MNSAIASQMVHYLPKFKFSRAIAIIGTAIASIGYTSQSIAVEMVLRSAMGDAAPVLAQAVTAAPDSTGTVVTQTGETFDVTGGTVSGENLFHSFDQFGLSAEQAAFIHTEPDIANILGRVVGGDPSLINGLLQVTGGGSNLFLINPAGIVFGADSQIIVPASFTATTADAVQIGEDWFTVVGTPEYARLIGAPTGFAFTQSEPGAIINAGNLTAPAGGTITLLGGIVISTGTIAVPGGQITIAAVPGENLVRLTSENSVLSLDLPVQTATALPDAPVALTARNLPALLAGGPVSQELGVVVEGDLVKLVPSDAAVRTAPGTAITAGTITTAQMAANEAGGNIDVLGDQVAVVGSTLTASGAYGGGNIRIGGDYQGNGTIANAERVYIDAASHLTADALSTGDGGQIIVWANNTTQFNGQISARGGATSGQGGFAEVSGRRHLAFNGTIDVSAPAGVVGALLLDPANVIIGANNADDSELDDGEIFADEAPGSTFFISSGKVVELLQNNPVTIDASDSISVLTEIDATGNTAANDLELASASILLSAAILSQGDVIFSGPVVIDSDVTVSTNGNIRFQDTLDLEAGTDVVINSLLGSVTTEMINGGFGPNAEALTISSQESISTGAIALDSVVLTTQNGDIVVDSINAGDRIEVYAGGLFRATGIIENLLTFGFEQTIPLNENPALIDFLVSQGFSREVLESSTADVPLVRREFPVSLAVNRASDEPGDRIIIRYQGAEAPDTGTLIDIQGEGASFAVGPIIMSQDVPFLPESDSDSFAAFDPESPFFIFINDAYTPLTAETGLPADVSGTVGAIVLRDGDNADIITSFQNQPFVPDIVNPDNGDNGDPGVSSDGDNSVPDSTTESLPESTVVVEIEEEDGLCENLQSLNPIADSPLEIDESVRSPGPSPTDDIALIDPCLEQDSSETSSAE